MNSSPSEQSHLPSFQTCLALSAIYQVLLGLALCLSVYVANGVISWAHLRPILMNWDARHYLFIAENGYPSVGEDSVVIVFFPLYPWLTRALTLLTGSFLLSGYLITASASLLAHALFIRYSVSLTNSRERGYRAAALFFLSPISIACTIPYTEALYLFAISFVLVGTHTKNWIQGVSGVAVACMTRLVGVLTAIPLFANLLFERPLRPIRIAATVLLIGIAAAVYPFVNVASHGDPLKFLSVLKQHWHKEPRNPFVEWWGHLHNLCSGTLPTERWMIMDNMVTLLVPLLLLYTLVQLIRRKSSVPWYWLLWSAANWAIVASQSSWLSNSRYLLACLPIYLMLEELLPKNRILFGLFLTALTMLSAVAFLRAGTGGWLY